jgi:hypothetical protein
VERFVMYFSYDADQHEQRHLIVSLRVNVIEKNS